MTFRRESRISDEAVGATTISLGRVLDALSDDIDRSIARVDVAATHNELGINLGELSRERYEAGLRATYEEFFSSSQHLILDDVLDYLSLIPRKSRQIPKNVYTTDIVSPDKFPKQFQSWTTVNPNWKILFVGDEEMDAWLERSFSGQNARLVEEFKALKGQNGIVRADLFR